jgi:Predicted permeases
MEIGLLIGQKVLSLLCFIIAGVIAARFKWITQEQSIGLSNITFNLFAPCLIISVFQIDFSIEKLTGLIFTVFTACITTLLFIILAKYAFFRSHDSFTNIEKAAVIYTNCGALCIPLINATMGKEAAFYSCGYLIVYTSFIWSHGVRLISGDKSVLSIKKILQSPNIIATAIGLLLFISGIRFQSFFAGIIEAFGNVTSMGALLVIGIILGNINLKEFFMNKKAYIVCFIRLIALPLLLILFLKLLHLSELLPDGRNLIIIVLFSACSPCATLVTILSQRYNKTPVYGSTLTVMSTLLCVITIPVMITLGQLLL